MSNLLWSLERPIEQKRLLNPAYFAALLWAAARGYNGVAGDGMPYPLIFLVPPTVLHRYTRQRLPRTTRTSLVAWLQDNTEVQLLFADRATSLVPFVKEGLIFGTNGALLAIESNRIIAAKKPRSMAQLLRESSSEVKESFAKAEFVGKWFASSGSYRTVMALWGIMP